jgi:hypothetical protein
MPAWGCEHSSLVRRWGVQPARLACGRERSRRRCDSGRLQARCAAMRQRAVLAAAAGSDGDIVASMTAVPGFVSRISTFVASGAHESGVTAGMRDPTDHLPESGGASYPELSIKAFFCQKESEKKSSEEIT